MTRRIQTAHSKPVNKIRDTEFSSGLLIYFNTIRYLKLRQIFYQLWYRLKWHFMPLNYRIGKSLRINPAINVSNFPKVNSNVKIFPGGVVGIQNLVEDFNGRVNWNFMDYGRLWNYQLQYLDFLCDDEIEIAFRKDLLTQVNDQIRAKKLRLEPYPVSLRLINSIIFIIENNVNDQSLIDGLALQYSYLQDNLEYHLLANHLLFNRIALCFVTLALNDEEKQEAFIIQLIEELEEQVKGDGAHYERSPAYHVQLLYRLLHFLVLLQRCKPELQAIDQLKHVCSKMAGWYLTFIAGSDHPPLFNDSVTSAMIHRKDLENILQQAGIEPVIISLRESGYRIYNHDAFYMILNCGEINPSYQPGHAHADILHFVLYYKEIPVLVDTGISSYEDPEWRNLERSTRMHNTVSCGNDNQSQLWRYFRVAKRAVLKIIDETKQTIEAEVIWHNRLVHHRKIVFDQSKIIIEDSIRNNQSGQGTPRVNFHFDYRLNDEIMIVENQLHLMKTGLTMKFNGPIHVVKENYKQAIDFNKRHEAVKISAYFTGSIQTEISWKP